MKENPEKINIISFQNISFLLHHHCTSAKDRSASQEGYGSLTGKEKQTTIRAVEVKNI